MLTTDNLYLSNRRGCSAPDGNSNRKVDGTPNPKNERQGVKQEGKTDLNSCLWQWSLDLTKVMATK